MINNLRLQRVLIYLFFKSEAILPHCKMKPKVSKDDILTPTSTFGTVHLQCEHDEAEKTEWHRGKRQKGELEEEQVQVKM